MIVIDLGQMAYHDAWQRQEAEHAKVLAGEEDRLLLVEHPPVITLGRRGETEGPKHLLASQDYLKQLGVELIQSDRGGDVTFHGPGQIVAYPIVSLNRHRLSVGGYVRRLEQIAIDTLAHFDVIAQRIDKCVGVWTNPADGSPEKVCAIGVRIKRGVSLHGIALNVTTDLRYFDLIVPCGLNGKKATSLEKLLGTAPSFERVKQVMQERFLESFLFERDFG